MKYKITVQAGIEILTFIVSTLNGKRMAEIRAKQEAYLMTGSEVIKVIGVKAL